MSRGIAAPVGKLSKGFGCRCALMIICSCGVVIQHFVPCGRIVSQRLVQAAHLQGLNVGRHILPYAVKVWSSVLCPNAQRSFGERHADRRPWAVLIYCQLAEDTVPAEATRHSKFSVCRIWRTRNDAHVEHDHARQG